MDLAKARANWVNLSVPGTFDVKTYDRRVDFEARLAQIVRWAEEAELQVVLSFRTGPGRSERDITGEEPEELNRDLFKMSKAQEAFIAM